MKMWEKLKITGVLDANTLMTSNTYILTTGTILGDLFVLTYFIQ